MTAQNAIDELETIVEQTEKPAERDKPCPWCYGFDIRLSIKRGSGAYYAACYCNNCHCYGPRVRYVPKAKDSFDAKREAENNDALREQAAEKWDSRTVV